MSDANFSQKSDQLSKSPSQPSLEREALLALRGMRQKIEEIEASNHEGIAIIGLACNLPGQVQNSSDYWRLLSDQSCAIRDIPSERMDIDAIFSAEKDTPGKTYSRSAGLLDRIDEFDAGFFGVSSREASQTDPQQRIFLECVWHALEDASIVPRSLADSLTSVFVGATTHDYANLQIRSVAPVDIDRYSALGVALNAIAGRVSYVLGLHGPSVCIDTACSSSLVAVDRACRSLRDGESTLALAGGVNILAFSDSLVAASRWGMLSSSGRVLSFGCGDGFVRGEGCGVVVLKRLGAARAAGDRVLGVILGSAVNHDGPGSGLTVPNGRAQAMLLRSALRSAGLAPSAVGYVEAHGTGTRLGDPIEAEALGEVFAGPREAPLRIGSVKTNLGHLEAAAGIAGLIKLVLALEHGEIPAQRPVGPLSEHVRWSELPLEVATHAQPWQPIAGRRIGGVSAFGFSGTNAHVIVEEAPALEPLWPTAYEHPAEVLALSAKTEAALGRMIDRYAAHLASHPEQRWADLCHTAGAGRSHFRHRLAIAADTAEEGLRLLRAHPRPEPAHGVDRPRLGFLFPGQLPPAFDLALFRELYAGSSVFRDGIDRCEQALQGYLEAPLSALVRNEPPRASALLEQPAYARAAEFAISCGLAALWRSWGAEPSAIIGHGAGEWAAAVARHALPLEQAVQQVAASGAPPPRAQSQPEPSPRVTFWIEMGLPSASPELPGNVARIASLRAGSGAWSALAQALADAYTAGLDIDWAAWNRDRDRRRIALPGYAFERQRHWFTPSAPAEPARSRPIAGDPAGHPLLGRRLRLAGPGTRYETLLHLRPESPPAAETSADTDPDQNLDWLGEHRIQGHALMPATAFIEILLAAGDRMPGTGEPELEDVLFSAPLPLDAPRLLQVAVEPGSANTARVRVYSTPAQTAAAEPAWTLHAEGTVLRLAPARSLAAEPAPPSLEQLRSRCLESIDAETFYATLNAHGAHFGPRFRGVLRLWRRPGEALAEIRIERLGQRLHPATLDACLQTAAAALPSHTPQNATLLPFHLNTLRFAHSAPTDDTCFVHATLLPTQNQQHPTFLLTLIPKTPTHTTHTHTTHTKPTLNLKFKTIEKNSNRVYEIEWISAPELTAMPLADYSGIWLILSDLSGLGERISRELSSNGGICHLIYPGETYGQVDVNQFTARADSRSDFKRILSAISSASTRLRIVHLWSLDAPTFNDASFDNVLTSQQLGYGSCLALMQAVLEQELEPSLFLITRSTKPSVTGRSSTAGPSLWAMRRALLAEHPQLMVKAIDFTGEPDSQQLERLLLELRSTVEPEVALQLEKRLVPHLALQSVQPALDETQAIELKAGWSGMLTELHHQSVARKQPAESEVEIEVHAAGLNFRDVLNVLGMLPTPTTTLGGECAGIVLRAGRNTAFSVGDKVLAFATGLFRSHVTLKASSVFRMPAGLTFPQAATLPVAYLTAIFALSRLSRLRSGETILIHAGAGGLGQAAVTYAKARGARIIATAGNKEKQQYLRSQGVELVMNSRIPDFADEVLQATAGRGVDVVLNSLDRAFIDESLKVLARDGRFLEVGKRDVLSHDEMKRRRPDVSYFLFDLGTEADKDPDLVPSLMNELFRYLRDGVLYPLPVQTFPSEEAGAAFSTMAHAKHLGKLALSYKHAWRLHPAPSTYLITGGLGSLGIEVAQWLIRSGASHLILVSRRPHPERDHVISLMKATAKSVSLVYADCSKPDEIDKALRAISPHPPLRGVVHCAGVLQDGTLVNQSWDSFREVSEAKIQGAWILHGATQGMPLDFFLTFSSAASIVGSPGQANYVAANGFLDALAHFRRGQGLPALSINWGPWQGDGMATGAAISSRHPGIRKIDSSSAFCTIEDLLQRETIQAIVLPRGDEVLSQSTRAHDSFFRGIDPVSGRQSTPSGKQMGAAPRSLITSRASLIRCIQTELTKVLGECGSSGYSEETSFADTGVDSLTAIELRNALMRSLGRTLPSTVALDYPTIGELADYLLATPPPGSIEASRDGELITQIHSDQLLNSLSEEEAEAILIQELEKGIA